MNYKTSCIYGGFEQVSSIISWWVTVVQISARKVVHAGLKGIRCNCIEILCKNLWHLFKTNKVSNEDILRLKSPSTRAFRWCIAHANSMCAHWVITIQNLCHTWVILKTTHFLYPKIRVNAWMFCNFSSQVEIRYLRQPLQVFTTIKWLHCEWCLSESHENFYRLIKF